METNVEEKEEDTECPTDQNHQVDLLTMEFMVNRKFYKQYLKHTNEIK